MIHLRNSFIPYYVMQVLYLHRKGITFLPQMSNARNPSTRTLLRVSCHLPWLTGVRECFLCLGFSWDFVTPLVASCESGKQLSRSALRHFSDPNSGTEHMKLVTAEAQPAALSCRETLLNRIVMKRNGELMFSVAVDWCSNWVFLQLVKKLLSSATIYNKGSCLCK